MFQVLNYLYLYSLNLWLLLSPWWLCFDWAMGCIPVVTSITDPRLLAPLFMIIVLVILLRKVVLLLDGHLGRYCSHCTCAEADLRMYLNTRRRVINNALP